MLVLILILIPLISSDHLPCVYPSFYWINNNFYKNGVAWPSIEQNQFIKTENFTQCGVEWPDLLAIDFTLVKSENLLWLLLFQQYCISSLNNGILSNYINNMTPEQKLLNSEEIYMVLDELTKNQGYLLQSVSILDRYCNNMGDMNYDNTKEFTIELLSNISILNQGYIVGYCEDQYHPYIIPDLSIFSLFYNESYYDESTYNGTVNISLIPQYYGNLTDKMNQFIYNNWIINISIDKKFALIIVTLLVLMCFTMVLQLGFTFGPCYHYQNKQMSDNETLNRYKKSLLWHKIRTCVMAILCCCGIGYIITYICCKPKPNPIYLPNDDTELEEPTIIVKREDVEKID